MPPDSTSTSPRAAPRRIDSEPAVLALLLALGQVVLWSTAFGIAYRAPEIDSAEQFVWSFSLENGYWKHPPLPSWLMYGLVRAFGASVALPFVATQVAIVVALALTWRLGCAMTSPRRALIATALTSLVVYHNMGGDAFNHNTVLLPFQAATVLFFHRACRGGRLVHWVLAGLFAGLSMLVKYVALLPLAGLLLYFAADRSLHDRRRLGGLLLAALVFALALLPHLLWLHQTDFLPFRYARTVTQTLPGVVATLGSVADFLAIQLVRSAPALLAGWWLLARRATAGRAAAAAPVAAGDRLFVWIVAVSPLALTLVYGLATATALQSRWGFNAFLHLGLLLTLLSRRGDDAAMLRRVLAIAVAVHLVLCIGMTTAKTVLADHFAIRTRANFPGAVLASLARDTWRQHTDAPLRLVVSDIWLGGNLIANNPTRLAVLVDGHHFKSPWVSEQAIRDCGALVLDDTTPDKAGRATPNPTLDALIDRADAAGRWSLPWADPRRAAPGSERGSVRWGVIKPAAGSLCMLP